MKTEFSKAALGRILEQDVANALLSLDVEGLRVYRNVLFPYRNYDIEIDVLAQRGNFIAIFECKNMLCTSVSFDRGSTTWTFDSGKSSTRKQTISKQIAKHNVAVCEYFAKRVDTVPLFLSMGVVRIQSNSEEGVTNLTSEVIIRDTQLYRKLPLIKQLAEFASPSPSIDKALERVLGRDWNWERPPDTTTYVTPFDVRHLNLSREQIPDGMEEMKSGQVRIL